MIVIAKDINGRVISIVNARSRELALAYWAGSGIHPHDTTTLDDYDELEYNPIGVQTLVTTKEVTVRDLNPGGSIDGLEKTVRIIVDP